MMINKKQKQEVVETFDNFDKKNGYSQNQLAQDRSILQDISKNGVEGIDNQYDKNRNGLHRVLKKYGLNKTLNELYKEYDLLRGGSDPEIYLALKKIDILEPKLKEEASQILEQLDEKITPEIKTGEMAIKNEVKQETISFKMEI